MINLGSFQPASNAADWYGYIEVLDDDTGTAWDMTGVLIELEVRDYDRCRRLYGSTSDAKLVVIDSGFEFNFPASSMRGLCAGSYTVNIRFTDADGVIDEPIITNLPVIEGGYL